MCKWATYRPLLVTVRSSFNTQMRGATAEFKPSEHAAVYKYHPLDEWSKKERILNYRLVNLVVRELSHIVVLPPISSAS